MSEEVEPTFDAEWEVDRWQTDGKVEIAAEDIEDCRDVQQALEQIDGQLQRDFEQTVHWFRANNESLSEWIQQCIDARKQKETQQTDDE